MPGRYEVKSLGGEVAHYPNVADVATAHRGWVAGRYVDGMPKVPFEVKNGFHGAGEERSDWAEPSEGCTWFQVIAGSVSVTFKTANGEESITCGPGEACYHSNAVPHKWIVNENGTHVLTVRTLEG